MQHAKPNPVVRREKSLSILCQKFLSFYPVHVNPNQNIVICLDNMASILEVERRRIYDIVNVLESVEILSRSCKNQYIWHGFSHIPRTLSKLKTLAVKSNFLEYIKTLMATQSLDGSNAMASADFDLHSDTKQAINVYYEAAVFNQCDNKPAVSAQVTSSSDAQTKEASTQTIRISREEKSLGIMSQKFLMLFLTSEDGLVSINFAARVLLGDIKSDTTELGRFKTKIRRLYDIANVLNSIGLIRKHSLTNIGDDQSVISSFSRPAYKYIGPECAIIRDAEYVYDLMNTGNPLSNSKHSLFDHFKRNFNLQKQNIPTFDVNTGVLTLKDKKNKRKAAADSLCQQTNSKRSLNKKLKLELLDYDDEPTALPATTIATKNSSSNSSISTSNSSTPTATMPTELASSPSSSSTSSDSRSSSSHHSTVCHYSMQPSSSSSHFIANNQHFYQQQQQQQQYTSHNSYYNHYQDEICNNQYFYSNTDYNNNSNISITNSATSPLNLNATVTDSSYGDPTALPYPTHQLDNYNYYYYHYCQQQYGYYHNRLSFEAAARQWSSNEGHNTDELAASGSLRLRVEENTTAPCSGKSSGSVLLSSYSSTSSTPTTTIDHRVSTENGSNHMMMRIQDDEEEEEKERVDKTEQDDDVESSLPSFNTFLA